MKIDRTVIVPYAAADMYALVDDIAGYPDFLPWCASTDVRRSGDTVEATLHIHYRGFRTSFATRNTHTPYSSIEMHLIDGPLSALAGKWYFIAIEEQRCRVEFNLCYGFSNRLLGAALAKIFAAVFDRFVDHFIEHAREKYRTISIEIVQAADSGKNSRTLSLPAGATVADALAAAGLPYSDSVSIFGKLCAQHTALTSGDRIEINQPLPQSPQEIRRQRA